MGDKPVGLQSVGKLPDSVVALNREWDQLKLQ